MILFARSILFHLFSNQKMGHGELQGLAFYTRMKISKHFKWISNGNNF